MKYKDDAKLIKDYRLIIFALTRILENGVLERYFRPEGKYNNNVCALPIDSGKLRLFCLRMSDTILVLGNGGVKNAQTYNENEELSGYVIDLQEFESMVKVGLKKGIFTIEEFDIKGIDN
ncbi:MAG: hypothetical protein PHD07_03730 [Bacteroidales bacterium]|nr:hypothetical protein [Bacteroidales bacterium]MDD3201472.1 hypothetical protein [Bacteroidales bacterium]